MEINESLSLRLQNPLVNVTKYLVGLIKCCLKEVKFSQFDNIFGFTDNGASTNFLVKPNMRLFKLSNFDLVILRKIFQVMFDWGKEIVF